MELLILIPLLLIPLVIVLVVRSAKKANEAWAAAGRILGLRYKAGALFKGRRMRGEVDGVGVVVETHTKSSGKNSQTYTRFRAYHPRPLEAGLKLTQQGFFAGIGKMLGIGDVETGDKHFDDFVLVKSSNPEFARAYLTPSRRRLVRHFLESYRSGFVDQQQVCWSRKGLVRHSGVLVSATRKLVALVRDLEEDRAEGEFFEETKGGRLVIVPPAPHTHEGIEIVEDRTVPAELSPLAGDDGPLEEVDEGFAPMEEDEIHVEPPPLPTREPGPEPEPEAVFEPGLELESEPAMEPVMEPVFEPEIEPEIAPADPARDSGPGDPPPGEESATDADDLDVAMVCPVLFGDGVSSIQAGKVFEKHYVGRRVRWAGTLRSADSFTYDFVFGDEAGTKAVFEVHLLEADTYRETWALAVVQLSPGVRDELRERKGETLTFEGVLKKAEGFTKSVFVANGELV